MDLAFRPSGMENFCTAVVAAIAAGIFVAAPMAAASAADASGWRQDTHSAFRLIAGANKRNLPVLLLLTLLLIGNAVFHLEVGMAGNAVIGTRLGITGAIMLIMLIDMPMSRWPRIAPVKPNGIAIITTKSG